jgi:carboxymethylenebutenolidase
MQHRKKATDFPREVLDLFDGYVHGSVSRREFLDRAARYAVGGVTAVGLLEALSPNFAWAQQVKADDPRIRAQRVDYPSPKGSGTMKGYLAQPVAGGKHPGVVVIHENRGLNPYIEDVARRLAAEGYVALAPDALAPAGGYPGDEDKAREAFAKLDPAKPPRTSWPRTTR